MTTVEVSARQFKERQKSFFEMADTGSRIVIRRGRKQSYILTPVQEDFVTPELLVKLERGRQQMREGKVTVCSTYEESLKFLESL